MKSLYQQVIDSDPERGYAINGSLYLGYGSTFEEVHREVHIEIRGDDAVRLAQARDEMDVAEMIANAYNADEVVVEEPWYAVLRLRDWDIDILPIA